MNLKLLNRVVELLKEKGKLIRYSSFKSYEYEIKKDDVVLFRVEYCELTDKLEVRIFNKLGCFEAFLDAHVLKKVIAEMEK